MKKDILSFTNSKAANGIVTGLILPVVIVVLAVLIVGSIMKPVNFQKQTEARKLVGIERLKDIRTLQDAYKSVNNKYAGSMDSLIRFYNEGELIIKLQIGSRDDSAAYAHTMEIKKSRFWLRGQDMSRYLYSLYQEGDSTLVFSLDQKIPVRDTLFNGRHGFCIDSLRTIPFSGGVPVIMDAATKLVSGVNVPLFEAKMPYRYLLAGMDNQLRINLDADCRNSNHYEGLQVGSISAPNNNAGNWE